MTAKVDFPFDSYHSFYYKTNYKFGQVSATVFDEIFQVDLPKYKKLMTNMKYHIIFQIPLEWHRVAEKNVCREMERFSRF